MSTAAIDSFTAAQVSKARTLIAGNGLAPTNREGVFRAVSSDGQRDYLVTAEGICECERARRDRACYHAAALASAARTARLDQARAAAKAAGWSATLVTETPGERAERLTDYALEG